MTYIQLLLFMYGNAISVSLRLLRANERGGVQGSFTFCPTLRTKRLIYLDCAKDAHIGSDTAAVVIWSRASELLRNLKDAWFEVSLGLVMMRSIGIVTAESGI
jgi:hypothetical protein